LDDNVEKEPAENQFEEISETATNALEETRSIVGNLRPQSLQRFGLTEALENMIDQVQSSTGVVFKRDINRIDDLFSDETEISIYRIVQEGLNNIIKHSESPRGEILIRQMHSEIELVIKDFGKGFSVKEHFESENEPVGFGLTSISQRVKLLGGDIKVASTTGNGTIISIYIKKQI